MLLILYIVVMGIGLCRGQSIVLPDRLFVGETLKEMPDDLVESELYFTLLTNEQLFRTAPAVTFEEYVTAPVSSQSLFYEFPDMPSEFYLHVLVLHLSKVKIPGLDAEMARYNLMLENFSRNLLRGGNYEVPYVPGIVSETRTASFITTGSGIVVSGCLDPFEAYNRWVQERRLMRAKAIIRQLEETPLPTREEMKMSTIKLPDNLLKENNYDVKVKQDGDNPPYRPYGQ